MATKSLVELNSDEAKQYIGAVVFIAILMVLGVIGNAHVLFVYALKMKASNHRLFILVLAVQDVITCGIGMPFTIVHLRNPLTFTMVSACKVLRFIIDFVSAAAVLVLLMIAVERYRKICVPLGRQISQKTAKGICLVVLGIALLLSWPALVLYGGRTVHIANQNVTGTRCSTDDKFKGTQLQAYINIVYVFIVFGVFTILVVLYSLVRRAIIQRSKFNTKPQTTTAVKSNVTTETPNTITSSTNAILEITPVDHQTLPLESTSANASSGTNVKDIVFSSAKTDDNQTTKHHTSKIKTRRTTYMLFMITVVFFVSYVPNLVLKIVTHANPTLVPNMSFAGRVLYNTFIWCFLISNAANPVIYGLCDLRFRREVIRIYRPLYEKTGLNVSA